MDTTSALYISRLELLTKDLLFMSESDYPWEIIYLGENEGNIDKQLLLDRAQSKKVEVADFLCNAIQEEDWYGEEELTAARKYQELLKILQEEMQNSAAYKQGEIEIHVFIIGQLPNKEWVALKTKSVET